jgi:uncharacterized protein YndB with AHSA1/START domain
MASVDVEADVPLSPQEVWDHVSDLSKLGDWLVLHEAWRGEVPEELTVGTNIEGVVRAKGMRNRVRWTVTQADPPRRLELTGTGKGGTKFQFRFTIKPQDQGSALQLHAELGGRALFGPIGSAAARAAKGDIQGSLERFVELHS